jgi:hypothetical protein
MLTLSACNGMGSCVAGGPAPCAGNLVCASATACNLACGAMGTGDVNCTGGYYCDGVGMGACQPQQAAGSPCGGADQCTSSVCMLNCCTGSCLGGACGATSCTGGSGGGACVYPGSSSTCAMPSCNAGVLIPNTCDGMGGCDTTAAACAGGFLCQDAATCAGSCGTTAGDTGCQTGYYCDGMGSGACQPKLSSGSACAADYMCLSQACLADDAGDGGSTCM